MKSPLKLFEFTLAVLLSSCYSHKSAVASGAHNAQLIQWPEGYSPETADFYVYNEIDIAASPEIVWDILIQAESWGQWYPHAKNLTIEQQHKDRLDSGVSFQWNPAKKLQFVSTVQVFNPPYQLAWSARESKDKMTAYHAWVIIPTPSGCTVITAESQNGPQTKPEKIFAPKMVSRAHQNWLLGLKEQAEAL